MSDNILKRIFPPLAAGLMLALALAEPASADANADCTSTDNARRIEGCTALLAQPDLPSGERAKAYALRALAYSVLGQYDRALPDYDEAIRINPDFAVALNNRAWAYYKAGRAQSGVDDVERALQLTPDSPHAYDTRAHIRQVLGLPAAALADYERAIHFGGAEIVKLYQCGLEAAGFYQGEIDGIYTQKFREALKACIAKPGCDPLPPDEECHRLTS